MESQIIFLGTAGDSYVCGRQIRASGGIVLQVDSHQFHIDPGPGSLVKMAQHAVHPRETMGIFVSNTSLLHCNDVNVMISAMTHDGLDRKGVLISNNSFANGTEEEKPYLSDKHKNFVERVITVKPGQKVGIENIEIEALPTKNSDPDALGFKFLTPKFNMVYTGDTRYSADVVKTYSGCDILIMNVTHPFSEKPKEGLNSEDAVKIIEKVKPKLAVITHFGAKLLSSDPMYEAREIQKQTGVQIVTAKDGLALNPISYAAQLRQKTLNLY